MFKWQDRKEGKDWVMKSMWEGWWKEKGSRLWPLQTNEKLSSCLVEWRWDRLVQLIGDKPRSPEILQPLLQMLCDTLRKLLCLSFPSLKMGIMKCVHCYKVLCILEEKHYVSANFYYSNEAVKGWCLFCKMIFKTWSIRMVTETISIKLLCFCPVTLRLQSKIVLWAFIRFYKNKLS